MAELHLGFQLDPATGKSGTDRLSVDSSDLTTHAAIVGMTGSDKTGLGIVLLEEALLAGVPLNVIGSLRAPPLSWDTEAETLRDEIEGAVTSLVGPVGVAADPLSSREFVLLSNLIENGWRAGQDLDLATLIGQVQSPPLRKLGVFDLDTFFPQPPTFRSSGSRSSGSRRTRPRADRR